MGILEHKVLKMSVKLFHVHCICCIRNIDFDSKNLHVKTRHLLLTPTVLLIC